jgi:hypothetical protein
VRPRTVSLRNLCSGPIGYANPSALNRPVLFRLTLFRNAITVLIFVSITSAPQAGAAHSGVICAVLLNEASHRHSERGLTWTPMTQWQAVEAAAYAKKLTKDPDSHMRFETIRKNFASNGEGARPEFFEPLAFHSHWFSGGPEMVNALDKKIQDLHPSIFPRIAYAAVGAAVGFPAIWYASGFSFDTALEDLPHFGGAALLSLASIGVVLRYRRLKRIIFSEMDPDYRKKMDDAQNNLTQNKEVLQLHWRGDGKFKAKPLKIHWEAAQLGQPVDSGLPLKPAVQLFSKSYLVTAHYDMVLRTRKSGPRVECQLVLWFW